MAHQLRITIEDVSGSITTRRVDFSDDLESQIEALLRGLPRLPQQWSTTRYETDLASLTWSTRGSRDHVNAVLQGCRQHGWPFVAYVHARSNDAPTTWSTEYARTYLGWWASRYAFAEEIANVGDHSMDEDSAVSLDPGMVDEICSGFLCLEVDSQVVAFDQLPDH